MIRMNGAVPSVPCMPSQRADPTVLYVLPNEPCGFYDAMLLLAPKIRRQYSAIYYHYIGHNGFGGLEVACSHLVHKFAGSNPAEAVGFIGRKNLQHAFLRRGSKAVGPMS